MKSTRTWTRTRTRRTSPTLLLLRSEPSVLPSSLQSLLLPSSADSSERSRQGHGRGREQERGVGTSLVSSLATLALALLLLTSWPKMFGKVRGILSSTWNSKNVRSWSLIGNLVLSVILTVLRVLLGTLCSLCPCFKSLISSLVLLGTPLLTSWTMMPHPNKMKSEMTHKRKNHFKIWC